MVTAVSYFVLRIKVMKQLFLNQVFIKNLNVHTTAIGGQMIGSD
jgi:hypothetical protein